MPDSARVVVRNDTCLFIGCADIENAHNTLSEAGLGVEPQTTRRYGFRRFSLRDPDNFELVFQAAR